MHSAHCGGKTAGFFDMVNHSDSGHVRVATTTDERQPDERRHGDDKNRAERSDQPPC